jgi:hypothetical protein
MQRQGRLALLPFDTLRTHVENYNGAFLRFTEKGWQPVAVDDRATRGVITVAGTRAILQRIKPGTAQMDGNVGVLSFDFSK